MDEADIKVEVLSWVRRSARGQRLPVVTSEFSLNGTGCRADLVLLGDTFVGVEIKSGADTLKRLPAQLSGYARYFDRTMLFVAPKHVPAVAEIDLYGADVWIQSGPARCERVTEGRTTMVCGHTLLGLLTASDERRAIRSIVSCDGGVDVHRARAEFETAFCRRYAATSNSFWDAVRGRKIKRDDLRLLSRFHDQRQQARAIEINRKDRWAAWASTMAAMPLLG